MKIGTASTAERRDHLSVLIACAARGEDAAFSELYALTSRKMQPDAPPLGRRFVAEAIGSFFLFACVIGSGIMAANLSGGNDGVALLGNTLATGAILFVLITMLGPISGAHFNPAVTGVFLLKRELAADVAAAIIIAQCLGALCGMLAVHLMFEEPVWQLSQKLRSGPAQWFSNSNSSR